MALWEVIGTDFGIAFFVGLVFSLGKILNTS